MCPTELTGIKSGSGEFFINDARSAQTPMCSTTVTMSTDEENAWPLPRVEENSTWLIKEEEVKNESDGGVFGEIEEKTEREGDNTSVDYGDDDSNAGVDIHTCSSDSSIPQTSPEPQGGFIPSAPSSLAYQALKLEQSGGGSLQIDFILRVYEAYLQNLQISQVIGRETWNLLCTKARELAERERVVGERERQVSCRLSTEEREQRVHEREIRMNVRENCFEEQVVKRVQDCLRQVIQSEQRILASFQASSHCS